MALRAPLAVPDLLAAADTAEIVALRIALSAPLDLARVPAVFGAEAPSVFGSLLDANGSGLRRYLCDLELRVGPDRRAAFRKSAIVSLGMPVPTGDGYRLSVEWRAATLAPLFPVLVGRLAVRADSLVLDGHYAPPFGRLGYVLDRRLLAIAARGTARWFLAQVAEGLAPGG